MPAASLTNNHEAPLVACKITSTPLPDEYVFGCEVSLTVGVGEAEALAVGVGFVLGPSELAFKLPTIIETMINPIIAKIA